MKVLVACEFSQVVTKAFREHGHEAYSCDVLPTEGNPAWHIQDDVLKHLNDGWDLMIAHPPCTYLANSGVQHLHKDPTRRAKLELAAAFFLALYGAPISKICVENPIPCGYANLPKYSQIIEPWMFGNPVSKRTCLWLKGLPPLLPTQIVDKGERYIGKDGRSNGSKWYQVPPSGERWKIRSRTFPGIAQAMATQWGSKF